MPSNPIRFLGIIFCSFVAMLAGCSGPQSIVVSQPIVASGISGMAKINDTHYLAVHDEKSFETGNRISIVEITADRKVVLTPVRPKKWKHPDGRSNDLEGVCTVPNREGEFLLVEAGHWLEAGHKDAKFGRLFHVKVYMKKSPPQIEVLHVFDLPEFNSKGRNDRVGDEIEGIACAARQNGTTLVLIGERGGSSAYRSGLIRWLVIDLNSKVRTEKSFEFTPAGRAGISINAPGSWSNPAENRDISALYLDSDNILWAAASEDPGEDTGPFMSIVYKIGAINVEDPDPLKISIPFIISHTVDGFKIEALAAPTTQIKGSIFAIGTEDESLGGAWRVLKKKSSGTYDGNDRRD